VSGTTRPLHPATAVAEQAPHMPCGPRRYRSLEIQAGDQTITAEDPLPDDLAAALKTIHRGNAHTN